MFTGNETHRAACLELVAYMVTTFVYIHETEEHRPNPWDLLTFFLSSASHATSPTNATNKYHFLPFFFFYSRIMEIKSISEGSIFWTHFVENNSELTQHSDLQ